MGTEVLGARLSAVEWRDPMEPTRSGSGPSRHTRLLASVAAGVLMAPGAALAQPTAGPQETALPEVVVTARRIEENSQRVPLTVTSVSPEIMRQENVTRPFDLTLTAPSLSIAPSFNRLNNTYSVRGLAAGVAVYFADSPCCAGNQSVPFHDIAQVQVLNGPQGTLFGRTSGAGAVLISPNRPELSDYSGSLEVRVGDYDRLQTFGVANLPLIEDHLGLRIAANTNSVAGYTHFLGGRGTLDDDNSEQIRAGLRFQSGNFDNYLVGSLIRVRQSGSSQVLRAIAVDKVAVYNLTPAAAAATFGGVCNQAVGLGFYGDAATCIAERAATMQRIRSALVTELARVSEGGDAIRFQPSNLGSQPALLWLDNRSLLNSAQYEFEPLGPLQLTVRDIASVEWCRNDTASAGDGAGGGAQQNAAFNTCGVAENNVVNGEIDVNIGRYSRIFNNDLQLQFDLSEQLLSGTLGFFYTKTRNPPSNEGTGNIYQLFSGVLSPQRGGHLSALGFVAPGNYSRQMALYGQSTLDLDRVGLRGLKLTAGYRYSWDRNINTRYPALVDNQTGRFFPSATITRSVAESKGYNYLVSLSEQFTPDLMVYGTVARAYLPGGNNANIQNATGLPNYAPTFGPQIVLEKELGAKYEFRLGGLAGRVNGAIYDYDFTDIAVAFSGLAGTTSISYTANVAAARLRGFEVQGTLLPSPAWELRFGYNHNTAKYEDWTASDPLNAARPGDAICLPSSPAGFCLLDLTENPFPRMPKHQGHLTLVYHAPIDPDLGEVDLSATLYAQSRVYFVTSAARQLQVLGRSALPGISERPYSLVNLRASWRNIGRSRWSAAAFVNNATDTTYVNGATAQLLTLGFATGTYAPPRMTGLELSRTF